MIRLKLYETKRYPISMPSYGHLEFPQLYLIIVVWLYVSRPFLSCL